MSQALELFPFKQGENIILKKSKLHFVFQRWEGNRIIAFGGPGTLIGVWSISFELLMWEGFEVV